MPGLIAAVHLAEYLVIGLAAAGLGLAVGWLATPLLFRTTAGLLAPAGPTLPPLSLVLATAGLAVAIACAGALAPVLRARRPFDEVMRPPRRRTWQVRLSRRLPVSVLIAVRIAARRAGHGRLVTTNTLISTAAYAAVLTHLAQDDDPLRYGTSTLPDHETNGSRRRCSWSRR
ncbi:hypothetical protein ACIA8K_35345 [Catenuloplanes sp. NPDC051500]|uniref:hypothetical protein n=1 Tax=Catenuloplanes sp. NPDC051500 TaxID=3363959 RepID=UPI0037AE560D